MPKLRDIQEQFARHLQGLPTSPDITGQVKFNRLENYQRLQVYQNNFKLSLTNNLAAIYPVVEKLVGEKFFKFACNEYIKAYPSKQGNLHEYGGEFAQFLSEFEPASSLSYLPDMAQFEWCYHQVFHEAGAKPFDLSLLQQVGEQDHPNIIFSLHPATRLIGSRFPLLKIWQMNQNDNPESLQLHEEDYYYLIGRRKNEMIFQTLEPVDFEFLSLIDSRQTLESISNVLIETDSCEPDLNQLLIKHVSTGTISGFEILPEPLSQRTV